MQFEFGTARYFSNVVLICSHKWKMTTQTIIRSACYLCENPIEFPAELSNQIIPCPHCGKEIKLIATSKPYPVWRNWFGVRSWNKKQMFISTVAIIYFFVTLNTASWEITYSDYKSGFIGSRQGQYLTETVIVEGTVFYPPYPRVSHVTAYRLLIAPLVLSWVAILAAYLPLMFLVRTRKKTAAT